MRTVYGIRFQIPGIGIHELRPRLKAWVEGKYRRAWSQSVTLRADAGTLRPLPEHEITFRVHGAAPSRFLHLEWTHPGDVDPTLHWMTSLILRESEKLLDCGVSVRISSTTQALTPLRSVQVGRPRIVTDLLHDFPCQISGTPIPIEASELHSGDIDDFVDALESEVRLLPVVLLSHDAWSGRPLRSAQDLQDRLLGLARVVEIDKFAGFELTAAVGRELTCYNGAIRLYWPDFKKTSHPFQHPLFLPVRINTLERPGRSFEDYLFNYLSQIAAARFTDSPLIESLRDAVDSERKEELAKLRQASSDEFFSQLEQEFDRLTADKKRLVQENAALSGRIASLEQEVETMRENIATISSYRPIDEVVAPETVPERRPSSVAEALANADRGFGDSLRIWSSARQSAEESAFGRPLEAYEALAALEALSKAYFTAKDRKESIGSWEAFLAQRGLKYAATESQTTMTKYRETRQFASPDGQRVEMEKHITLGGGSRTHCMQIYFEANDELRKFDIGYCGVHLPYAGQRT